MKRVAIIGCPGAGKTTFSRKLAAKTGLPLTHLDYYYHQADKDYENDKVGWRKLVKDMVNKESWIIEGNYKSTFKLRLPRADTIIFFDYPRYISVWRTLKRRIQYHNKLRSEMPEGWKEMISPAFLKYVWSFNTKERPEIYKLLKTYDSSRVVILKNPKATKRYLAGL